MSDQSDPGLLLLGTAHEWSAGYADKVNAAFGVTAAVAAPP